MSVIGDVVGIGGDYNVIETVKRNGVALPVADKTVDVGVPILSVKENGTILTPDVNKAVNITVPTKVSDLANDSQFQTPQQMKNAVDAATKLLYYAEAYGPDSVVSFDGKVSGFPMRNCRVEILPVQAGSGDPSPTNIRPISGWTGATVTRAGKNLFDIGAIETNSVITNNGDGTITVMNTSETAPSSPSATWGPLRRYAPGLETGKTYTLRAVSTAPSANQVIYLRGADVVWRFGDSKLLTEAMLDSLVYFYAGVAGGTAVISELQIEEGTVQTAYEPYQSDVYSVSWQSQAGTVYGGALYVGSGVLTVTHGQIASYAGETLPGWWISDRDIYAPGTSPTTGAQVVYALASPVSYQLTAQDVRALSGVNHVWADTGDVAVAYGGFLFELLQMIRAIE